MDRQEQIKSVEKWRHRLYELENEVILVRDNITRIVEQMSDGRQWLIKLTLEEIEETVNALRFAEDRQYALKKFEKLLKGAKYPK